MTELTDLEVWKRCFEIARENGWKHEDNNPFIYPIPACALRGKPNGGVDLDGNDLEFGDSYGVGHWNLYELLYDITNGFAKALFGQSPEIDCGGGIKAVKRLGWYDHLSGMLGQNTTEYLRLWLKGTKE